MPPPDADMTVLASRDASEVFGTARRAIQDVIKNVASNRGINPESAWTMLKEGECRDTVRSDIQDSRETTKKPIARKRQRLRLPHAPPRSLRTMPSHTRKAVGQDLKGTRIQTKVDCAAYRTGERAKNRQARRMWTSKRSFLVTTCRSRSLRARAAIAAMTIDCIRTETRLGSRHPLNPMLVLSEGGREFAALSSASSVMVQ